MLQAVGCDAPETMDGLCTRELTSPKTWRVNKGKSSFSWEIERRRRM